MASNPIQKKVRNAVLIGVTVTLLIMGVVVAFLLMELDKIKKEQEEIQMSYRTIYTLSQDVKSGDIITANMLQQSIAQQQHIPVDAPSTASMLTEFANQSLVDINGNTVKTDPVGAFLQIDCDYTEIYEDAEGYYTYSSEGEREGIKGLEEEKIIEDKKAGEKYIKVKATKKTRLYYEEDEYYIKKIAEDGSRVREIVEIFGVPLIAKVDMSKNTVLTMDMVSQGSPVHDGIRKQEYNAIVLPTDLVTGDYVDIRLMLPNGQDYIVIPKKVVELPVADGMESESTIWLNLSEDEILTMSCAIVEAYRINGSKLYATKYTEPGRQDAASQTYPISAETYALIQADPNVTDIAEQALNDRYTDALLNIRNNTINIELQKDGNSSSNVPSKINESIVKTQEERKKYLQSLANGGTY